MAPGKQQKFTYKSQRRNTERKETYNPRAAKRAQSATWDDSARQEYLTGFSKRKKGRKEFAQKKAEEAARLERNELRAQVRAQLKERAAENVRAAHERYGDPIEGEETTEGEVTASEAEDGDEDEGEQDFNTEDGFATVTVEPFDMDAAHEAALQHRAELDRSDDEEEEEEAEVEMKARPKSRWQHNKQRQQQHRGAGGSRQHRQQQQRKPYSKRQQDRR